MSKGPKPGWKILAYDPEILRTVMSTITLSVEAAIMLIPSFSGGSETELLAFETK